MKHIPTNITYTISYEPMESKYTEMLPKDIKDNLERFYNMIMKEPEKLVMEMEELNRNYNNPVVKNYLYNSYVALQQHEQAQRMAKENFSAFPDYLFARLNYASELIIAGKHKQVPKLFSFCYDIGQYYPNRKIFHITEVSSFYSVMFRYFIATGEYKVAKEVLRSIKTIDPSNPNLKCFRKEVRWLSTIKILAALSIIIAIPYIIIKALTSKRSNRKTGENHAKRNVTRRPSLN